MIYPNYTPFDMNSQYDPNSMASVLSAIQSAFTSIGSSITNTSNPLITTNGSWNNSISIPIKSKFGKPKFDMSFYQSENGGFIMELRDGMDSNYDPKSKLFIIKEIENMGTEIQNILLQEILKG